MEHGPTLRQLHIGFYTDIRLLLKPPPAVSSNSKFRENRPESVYLRLPRLLFAPSPALPRYSQRSRSREGALHLQSFFALAGLLPRATAVVTGRGWEEGLEQRQI